MTRTRSIVVTVAVTVAAIATLAGCRGQISTSPPRRLYDDMVWQPKYRPEAKSTFFADGRAMRPPVEGTVAIGTLDPVTMPAAVDEAFARRGQQRFDIYCAACHDRSGSGHGMVVQRGFPLPIDLASDRARGLTDQQLFDTITAGVRNMPSYAAQVPARDRWAIVVWLRVLQRSQHTTLADVPAEMREVIAAEDPK
jgi:mono/diheme cytochrome c family protein